MSTPPSPHVPPIPPIGSGQRVNKRFRSDERVEPAASVPPLPVRERPAPRYQVLDTLRGFAICGILLVNIGDITHLGMGLPFVPRSPSIAENTLYYLVSTRFVPIFAFMFGMSLRFVSDSALKRGQSPWKVVGRRMIALLAIGFLHSLVYSGEVLTEYAVIGLLMLPIVLKAPRLLVAILGVAGTVASFAWGGSGVINVPGLFLLGAAAVAYGLPAYLEHPDRRLVMTTAALALAAVPAVIAPDARNRRPPFRVCRRHCRRDPGRGLHLPGGVGLLLADPQAHPDLLRAPRENGTDLLCQRELHRGPYRGGPALEGESRCRAAPGRGRTGARGPVHRCAPVAEALPLRPPGVGVEVPDLVDAGGTSAGTAGSTAPATRDAAQVRVR